MYFTVRKWGNTLLEGHSILSLKGILLGDYDVEKNDKWSCTYAIESQKYQVVCTRPDIASVSVEMLDGFDCGVPLIKLKSSAYVQYMETLSATEAMYMTLTKATKEAIWLKGLAIELGFELKIVVGIPTRALS
ncbi:hypothetical protein Tco_0558131 [Tanacetum coccineum]